MLLVLFFFFFFFYIGLQLTWYKFFGKILFWGFCAKSVPEGAQSEVFQVYIVKNQCLIIFFCFLFVCFFEKSCTVLLNKKAPKMDSVSFITSSFIACFWFFTWSYSSWRNSCIEVFGSERHRNWSKLMFF